jgi:hypothetical protein
MISDEKSVAINLRSRPLRLVYLVTCIDDLRDAISLYTYTWGGAANAILYVSDEEDKIHELKRSIAKYDPDYILSTEGKDIFSEVKKFLKNYPAIHRILRQKEIEDFVNGQDIIKLITRNLTSGTLGKLTSTATVLESLYPSKINDSEIYILENVPSEFSLEISLQFGDISQHYRQGLIQHLGAKSLLAPKNSESFFKAKLCLSKSSNPILLTLENIKREHKGDWHNTGCSDHLFSLCFFLYDDEDIGMMTSFWNARWFQPSNKFLVQKKSFICNLEEYIKLAFLAMPLIELVHISANIIDRDEANDLYKNIKNIVEKIVKREVKIWLSFKSFSNIRKISSYTSSPKITSQKIALDNSLCFLPEVPKGLEADNFLFGYDLEIDFTGGNKLVYPKSSVKISTLLSNSLDTIEMYKNEEKKSPSLSIRGTDYGISGIGVTGKECKVYLHSDSVIVTNYMKDKAGIEIKSNRHTRYAEGFVKRLGGIEKIYSFTNNGGIETVLSLCSKKSDQSGQCLSSLVSFLRDQLGIEQKNAQMLIKSQLKDLLKKGLVKRGIALKCPICDLETWYSISSLSEFVECQGCLDEFQLDDLDKYLYSYQPNQLTHRLISNGGIAVLATANSFLTTSPHRFIQFGGDLFKPNERQNFGEIDLIVMAGETCLIAECKYFPKIDSEEQIQIALNDTSGLKKAIIIAKNIMANVVILGITTNLEKSDEEIINKLKEGVSEIKVDAETKGIGVYLLFTGKGSDKHPLINVNLQNLIPGNVNRIYESIYECGLGSLPSTYPLITSNQFNEEVLKSWKDELTVGCV